MKTKKTSIIEALVKKHEEQFEQSVRMAIFQKGGQLRTFTALNLKARKLEIVRELEKKHREHLDKSINKLETKYARGRLKKGSRLVDVDVFSSVDIFLFQKWAYRVGKGWYGFELGNAPYEWGYILHHFLIWVETLCPDFEIQQIKIKLGGLRFYIDTHSEDADVTSHIRGEITKLEDLLRHANLIY